MISGGNMEEKVYQAKTLGDAITDACAELGVTSDKLDYTVVQEGKNGFFGFGAKPFIIKVRVKSEKQASANNKQDMKPVRPQKEKNPERKDQKDANARKNDQKQRGAQNDQEKKQNSGRDENRENKNERGPKKDRGDRNERGDRQDRKEGGNNQNRGSKKKFNRDANAAEQNGKDASDKKSEKFADGKNSPVREKNSEVKAERTEKSERSVGKVTGDPAKVAEEFLKGLFQSMEAEISYKSEFNSETNELKIDLSGDDTSIFIGKRGQTLDALQYLTSQVVNKHQTAYIRVKLDTENYRERRKDTMETLAKNIAQKVKRTKKPVALEPMNPYERRIIHSVLQGDKEIITRSEGVEPYRHVVVCPVKKRRNEKGLISAVPAAAEIKQEVPSIDAAVADAELKAKEIAADRVNAAENAAEAASQMAEKLEADASAAVDKAAEAAQKTAEDLAENAAETKSELRDTAADLVEAADEKLDKAADVIEEAKKDISDAADAAKAEAENVLSESMKEFTEVK